KNSASHYVGTGPEILASLDGSHVDYLIAGLGTAGSSRGTGTYLKEDNSNLKLVGVVARKGQLIPGIRSSDEMYEVGLFDKSIYTDIVEVDGNGAIEGVLTLCRRLGIMAGPSSGAAYMAALAYLQQIDGTVSETRNAVFIICDRVEKYVSYLQKLRPDIFGLGNRKPSPLQLTRSQANHAQQISVEEAQRWLAGGASPPCLVVDLRGPIAFRASHIPGSVNMRS